jgi:uncharacterized integral membrane protein
MLSLSPALVKDSVLALSAITKYDAFNTLMYSGALIGFGAMLFTLSTGGGKGINGSFKGFLIAYFVFLLGAKAEVDMVVTSPVTAESYAISDAPAGLAILGWGTSAVGKVFKDMYSTEMTPPGVGEILTRNGVGRGLAVLTGMQGVPWSDVSRTAGNTGTNLTNIEQSIANYLKDCFNPMVTSEGGGEERWAMLHNKGDTSSLTGIWTRMQAPIVRRTTVYINSASASGTGQMCWDAWSSINTAISAATFSDALSEDATSHYAKQLAAMSMPGASVTLDSGTSTDLVRQQLLLESNAMLNAMFGDTTMRARILFLDRLNGMLLDAYGASPRAQVAGSIGRLGSAWDDAKRQADLSMAAQGDWWTRNAKPMTQYLELIVLGFLPILIFMMFATPNGLKAMGGIVFVYFWLQSWPIAYIILNHASMGSMVATFDQFISSTATFGMEDMYSLWDQARHSYAVSQSLLGMTPILTGALLTGSMMMLTRLAGGLGGSENMDESRVYNDTEQAAPLRKQESQVSYQTDINGNVQQNRDLTGTGTDINVSDTLAQQTQEARTERDTAASTHQKQVSSTLNRAIQNASTEQLNQIVTAATGHEDGLSSSAVTGSTQMTATSQSWADTNAVRLAGELTAQGGGDKQFIERLKNGDEDAVNRASNIARGGVGAKASAGLSNELATKISEEFRESEEFKTGLSQTLSDSKSFNTQDGYSKLASVSENVSEQDAQNLAASLSNVKTLDNAYSVAASQSGSVSTTRTIDEGRQWKVMEDIIKSMELSGATLQGEEQKAAMVEAAKERGLSEENAKHLTGITQSDIWVDSAPSNAGAFSQGAGSLALLRSFGDTQDLNEAIIKNDSRVGENAKDMVTGLNRPEDNIDTSGVQNKALNDEVEKALAKNITGPSQNFKPEDQAKVDAVKSDVATNMNYEQRKQDLQEAIAKKANNVEARGQGNYGAGDTLSGGSLAMRLANGGEDLQGYMKDEGAYNALGVILASNVAAQLAKDSGQDDAEQNLASDLAMSNLLRSNDKNDFDKMISAGNQSEAQTFLENKLSQAGVQTDRESLEEFGSRIGEFTDLRHGNNGVMESDDPNYYINQLGMLEKIGNAIKGKDNNEVSENIQQLEAQVNNLTSPSTYGALAYADSKAESVYDKTKEDLQEQRESKEEFLTDVVLSELMALAPYVAQDGKGKELSGVINDVKADASGLEGGLVSGVRGLLAGMTGNGQEGLSIDRGEIAKLFDDKFGDGAYEGYRDQMSNDLKAQVNSDESRIIERMKDEIKEKMNPESSQIGLDNTVKEALSRMDLSGLDANVMNQLARSNPDALLALESQVANYESPAQADLEAMLNKAQGDGAYQAHEFNSYKAQSDRIMNQMQGDLDKMMTEMNEQYADQERETFTQWKNSMTSI